MQGGYGDQLGIDELIKQKEALVEIMVSERNRNPNLRDDLIQEGRIAVWQVRDRAASKDNPDAYLHAAIRHRVSETMTRETWTGHSGVHGHPVDPLRRDRDYLDDPDQSFEVAAPETFEAVEWAYHHGEIVQVLNELSPRHRQYVVDRFWGGMTNAELAARDGINTKSINNMWLRQIRPVLAEKLGYLVEV